MQHTAIAVCEIAKGMRIRSTNNECTHYTIDTQPYDGDGAMLVAAEYFQPGDVIEWECTEMQTRCLVRRAK